jgi:hypothetical protein
VLRSLIVRIVRRIIIHGMLFTISPPKRFPQWGWLTALAAPFSFWRSDSS